MMVIPLPIGQVCLQLGVCYLLDTLTSCHDSVDTFRPMQSLTQSSLYYNSPLNMDTFDIGILNCALASYFV